LKTDSQNEFKFYSYKPMYVFYHNALKAEHALFRLAPADVELHGQPSRSILWTNSPHGGARTAVKPEKAVDGIANAMKATDVRAMIHC